MSKQLVSKYVAAFNPTAQTLDFTSIPNFTISKLYAVINVTRGTPIYVAGAPGLGASVSSTSPNVISLTYNTSTHAASDILNIYYDTAAGVESNTVAETGGQLELMQEKMDQILSELKVMTEVLIQGFNGFPLSQEDSRSLRNDINNPSNVDNIENTQ